MLMQGLLTIHVDGGGRGRGKARPRQGMWSANPKPFMLWTHRAVTRGQRGENRDCINTTETLLRRRLKGGSNDDRGIRNKE